MDLTEIYEVEIPDIESFIDLEDEPELPVDMFQSWWVDNEEFIRLLLKKLANDMFYILFGNRELLLKFNEIVSLAFDHNDFPESSLTTRKRVIRKQPPKWVKVAVYSRDKGHCTSCGKDLTHLIVVDSKQHYDHMVPLNLFGPNDPTNIQLLCETCNRDKSGDKISTSNYYMNWWK
jgi:5-methylcytosine-specific restriction endonuclease McrA